MVLVFKKNVKNASDMATNYHIFLFFGLIVSILLPCDYAVRLGSRKKQIFEKWNGNPKFTDPTFDFFYRQWDYHLLFFR